MGARRAWRIKGANQRAASWTVTAAAVLSAPEAAAPDISTPDEAAENELGRPHHHLTTLATFHQPLGVSRGDQCWGSVPADQHCRQLR